MSSNGWQAFLQQQADGIRAMAFAEQQRSLGKVVYPPAEQVHSAFALTAPGDIKVVILGQDPYHGPDQAHGLCFSVLPGVKVPPSLNNIYKELERDFSGFERPGHGYLHSWATRGVFLLNTVLTVEQGAAHSHAKCGWEAFTDAVIEKINRECQGVVFMLWGSHAQKKGRFIDTDRHHVLASSHPSPLSAHRGFLGCGHFSQANKLLMAQGIEPVDWRLPKNVECFAAK